jgi:hypothetical protein
VIWCELQQLQKTVTRGSKDSPFADNILFFLRDNENVPFNNSKTHERANPQTLLQHRNQHYPRTLAPSPL